MGSPQPATHSVCQHPAGRPTPVAFARTYPGQPGHVPHARSALAAVLAGCPLADESVLVASELAANAAIHSKSGLPGGTFTVRAAVHSGAYVRLEVEDQGGPWSARDHGDGRPHGLNIVASIAGSGNWGVTGGEGGRTVRVQLGWPTN